jgi:hypothetical protein
MDLKRSRRASRSRRSTRCPQAGLELGLDQVFELHDWTPALPRRAGEEIIALASGVQEASWRS